MLKPSAILYPPVDPEQLPVADLDWATGIIRMFVTYDEFSAILAVDHAALDAERRFVLEALTHEGTHLLQLGLTGYAYEISARLFQTVVAAVREHESLEAILAHRGDYVDEIKDVMASLRRPGPGDITPLIIMESAAFHAQKLTHYDNVGPADYEEILELEAPSGEYRAAYDVAADYLGVDALDHFPHVANLALAAARPEQAFSALLDAFRDERSRLNIIANHQLGLAVLNTRFADGLLGSAMDRVVAGQRHPILERLVLMINQLAQDGVVEPPVLMARGRIVEDEVASRFLGPVAYMPTPETDGSAPIWVPPHWQETSAENPLLRPDAMRFIFAADILLQQDLDPIEPEPLRPPARSVATSEYNMSLRPRFVEFKREERTAENAADFAATLAAKPDEIRVLRGTIAITFPGEEFPSNASPYADPGVQGFLHELYTRIPHLLYFLADTPDQSALLSAVAAFVPEELVFDGDAAAVAVTERVAKTFAILCRRAVAFARQQDQPGRVVLGHLREFQPDLRKMISDYALATDDDVA